MRRAGAPLLALLLSVVAALAVPAAASAHGLGGLTNLPIPGWMFLVGGATVLVVSFLGLAVLWPEPRLSPPDAGRPMPGAMQRVILSRSRGRTAGRRRRALRRRLVCGGIRLDPRVPQSRADVRLRRLLGRPGRARRPLRRCLGVARSLAHDRRRRRVAGRRLGVRPRARSYPDALGVLPAVVLLLAFVSLELVYDDPANPRVLAVAILVYSVATWSGAAVFGRDAWRRNGDGFALYFCLLSKLALVGTRVRESRREAVFRRPLARLTAADHRRGIVAFLAVMLGSVAFDGFSGSSCVAGPDARHPDPARERRMGRRGADGCHVRRAPGSIVLFGLRVHRSPSARRGSSPGRRWATQACSSTA